MTETQNSRSSGYWFAGRSERVEGVDVLNLLRKYRSAEAAMRRRTRESMGMGETDLLALRYLLQAERTGAQLKPKDLAERLGISSASTTILLDRLERSGHLKRAPHPSDRRALVIVPTMGAEHEVRTTLGHMHDRMLEVADALEPEDAAVVATFLQGMVDAVERADHHEADSDREGLAG